MNYQMSGMVVLVTGGSRGLGKCIVKKFLESETIVVFADVDIVGGEATQKELSELGTVEFIQCDVTSEADVAAMIQRIVEKYGRLDFLVNNAAAVTADFVPLHENSYTTVQKMNAVNIGGTFLCMKYAIEQMLRQPDRGSIVNISSASALYSSYGLSIYAATKRAVNALTQVAAKEYANQGIRINAILPGSMENEAMQEYRENNPESYATAMAATPVGRTVDPMEVAQAVVWLCSKESDYAIGLELVFDGGVSL